MIFAEKEGRPIVLHVGHAFDRSQYPLELSQIERSDGQVPSSARFPGRRGKLPASAGREPPQDVPDHRLGDRVLLLDDGEHAGAFAEVQSDYRVIVDVMDATLE